MRGGWGLVFEAPGFDPDAGDSKPRPPDTPVVSRHDRSKTALVDVATIAPAGGEERQVSGGPFPVRRAVDADDLAERTVDVRGHPPGVAADEDGGALLEPGVDL